MGNCPNAANLGSSQKDMAARIIHAGDVRGFSDQMINFALKAAFIESSLGTRMGPPWAGSDHLGLYQWPPHPGAVHLFEASRWKQFHRLGRVPGRGEIQQHLLRYGNQDL